MYMKESLTHQSDGNSFCMKQICAERGLYDTPNLNTVLYLHHCGLTIVPKLHSYGNLKCLYLNNNDLEAISGLEALPLLQLLHLNDNRITSMSGIESCRRLRRLDLANNLISEVSHLEELVHLESLNLSQNLLCMMDHCQCQILKRCAALVNVNLSKNQITEFTLWSEKIPVTFQEYFHSCNPLLRNLDISMNPVCSNIHAKGTDLLPDLIYLNNTRVMNRSTMIITNVDAQRKALVTERRRSALRRIEDESREDDENLTPIYSARDSAVSTCSTTSEIVENEPEF